MKVRWKEHEMIVVAILALWQTIILVMNAYNHSFEELQAKKTVIMPASKIFIREFFFIIEILALLLKLNPILKNNPKATISGCF